jgi:hypothetical protein
MTPPDFSMAQWRKSDDSADGGCVEVAYVSGSIGVRDSKAKGRGPLLVFNEREWRAFLAGARRGEFDLPALAD